MTRDDALEYARMVKALDVVVLRTPAPLWPLCQPAVELLREVERTRYACTMCHSYGGHRCSCPVSTTKRGLRARGKRDAA